MKIDELPDWDAIIEEVRRLSNGWEILADGFWVRLPEAPEGMEPPRKGDKAAVFTDDSTGATRGVRVNDKVFFYWTKEENAKRLKQLNHGPDPFVPERGEEGFGEPVEGEARFAFCRRCKVTLDALIDPEGVGTERIVPPERLKCPRCGNREIEVEALAVEDRAFKKRMAAGKIIKAEYVGPKDPEIIDWLLEGASALEDANIFGTEMAEDGEPCWPRRLCEVIVGCAMYLKSEEEEEGGHLWDATCWSCDHRLPNGRCVFAPAGDLKAATDRCGRWAHGES